MPDSRPATTGNRFPHLSEWKERLSECTGTSESVRRNGSKSISPVSESMAVHHRFERSSDRHPVFVCANCGHVTWISSETIRVVSE